VEPFICAGAGMDGLQLICIPLGDRGDHA
jgi:hypothetical protein